MEVKNSIRTNLTKFLKFLLTVRIFHIIIITPKIYGGKNMKSTGMVRPVDELGRIVLPKEIRKNLNINPRDSVEIFTDEHRIVLQKYEPACIFCGNADNITVYEGKRICSDCINKIKSVL